MASLIKKGKVWYAVYYAGKGEARKKVWKSLSPDKSAAQVKFGDLVEELTALKYGHTQKQISWQSFCEKYLAYSQTNKKPSLIECLKFLNRVDFTCFSTWIQHDFSETILL